MYGFSKALRGFLVSAVRRTSDVMLDGAFQSRHIEGIYRGNCYAHARTRQTHFAGSETASSMPILCKMVAGRLTPESASERDARSVNAGFISDAHTYDIASRIY